jgi:hypothetical protein
MAIWRTAALAGFDAATAVASLAIEGGAYAGVTVRRKVTSATTAAAGRGQRVISAVVPRAVDVVLNQIDLTEIVLRRVDLDAIARALDVDAVARRLDVDAVASRVDVDAVIARVDLLGLADYVVAGIDLPELIRRSTGSAASEAVRGVRMQSMEADQALSNVIDRLLLRRRTARSLAPPLGVDGSAP